MHGDFLDIRVQLRGVDEVHPQANLRKLPFSKTDTQRCATLLEPLVEP